MGSLTNKHVIVGISGGIAAYKSAEIVRRLQDHGAEVRVVMTTAATEFIRPMTLQALSGHPVHTDLLDEQAEAAMGHIELARWADLLLIAPASANFISTMVHGGADSLLGAIYLATSAKVVVAPAMNQAMWSHPATTENIKILKSRDAVILNPDDGPQACGDVGPGRLQQPQQLVDQLVDIFECGLLAGKKVVITETYECSRRSTIVNIQSKLASFESCVTAATRLFLSSVSGAAAYTGASMLFVM